MRGIYDDLKTEGSIIHHDRNGLRLTVESHGLSDAHRAEAILEEAATELKQ